MEEKNYIIGYYFAPRVETNSIEREVLEKFSGLKDYVIAGNEIENFYGQIRSFADERLKARKNCYAARLSLQISDGSPYSMDSYIGIGGSRIILYEIKGWCPGTKKGVVR